jgi:O-antigen ligase
MLLSVSPVIRAWWRAFISRPQAAMLVVVAVASTQLGSGEGADLARLQSGLPDPARTLRALLYTGMFMISALGLINDPKRWTLSGRGVQWMMLYALFATTSAIYSVYPLISVWKGFEVVTLVMVAITVSKQLRDEEGVRWLLDVASLIALYMVLTVIVGIALYPHEALKQVDELTGTGYFGSRGLAPIINPASQGAYAGILAISAIVPLLNRNKLARRDRAYAGLIVVVCLGIALLLLARSRTQIFAFCAALMCVFFFGRYRVLAAITALTGTIVVLASDTVLNFIYRGQSEEQFTSFTGRTTVWNEVMDIVNESPIIGQGFYAAQRQLYGSGSVDNTYLEALVGLGLVGLILLVIPVFITGISLLKLRLKTVTGSPGQMLWLHALAFFAILVIRSIASPTFASMHPMLVFYLLTHLAVAALVRINKTGTKEMAASNKVTPATPGHVVSTPRLTKRHLTRYRG